MVSRLARRCRLERKAAKSRDREVFDLRWYAMLAELLAQVGPVDAPPLFLPISALICANDSGSLDILDI
jgi:hypothetical protein